LTFDPTPADFAALAAWPNGRDPLAAIGDYAEWKRALRWLKPAQRQAHGAYTRRRADWVRERDFEAYFKDTDRTIDRRRWEYLKARKAWYIMPLEWDRFAAPNVRRVLDLGCGDGDVTQRIADWVARRWQESGGGHDLEIVGIDLSESRIRNARDHCTSPDPRIRFTFTAADVTAGLPYPPRHFDYGVCSGVFEILDDIAAAKFARGLCDSVAKGVHIEDLLDRYPGGYPREDLGVLLGPNGFRVVQRALVLTEPFSLVTQPDPCRLWPILRDQNVWAERV
jgi:SAM-dependent methyltransferase